MWIHVALIVSALSAAVGQMLFRVGAQGRTSLLEFVNWPLTFGLSCYALSAALWIFSLSRLPLKTVYPFTALTFVIVYAAAILVLDERPTWRGLVGIALVLIGLYFVLTDR